MSDSNIPLANRPRVPWVILGYGVFVFLMLPRGVVAMNDDFGYLGSVIETLRRHRPWTDDWLEPWSASLAVIAAILYKVTGSFLIATQGLQALGSAAACAGAHALCRLRDISPGKSLIISILGLTFPALLWKSLEFTALVLYVPCLLWAVWAAGRRRWGLFYLAWVIAFSSRQSAIVWLVLPLWEVLRNARALRAKVIWSPPGLVLWGAIATYAVLSAGMNQTQAQRMITHHLFEQIQIAASLRNFALALGTFVIFSGIGALVQGFCTGDLSVPPNIRRRIMVALVLGVGLFSFVHEYPRVFAEHQNYEGWSGRLYGNILLAAGVAGWLMARFTFRRELLSAGLAAGLLVCLRADVWDYYYADVAILAFFSVAPPGPLARSADLEPVSKGLGFAAVLVLAVFHLGFVFEQKCRVDRDHAVCVISEKALRAGEVQVTDLHYAPYGFIGWQLHRRFVAHEGRNDPDIGGFMRYQRPGATELRLSPMRFWQDSKSLEAPKGESATRVIRSEIFRVGWLWHQRVTLLQPASAAQIQPARLALDATQYQTRRFPLTDQEWREAIESPAR